MSARLDIERYLQKSPENRAAGDSFRKRLSAFLTPDVLCLFWHRLAHYFYCTDRRRLARWTTRWNFALHKVFITPQSCIGPGCRLPHPAGVTFHGRAGRGVSLLALSVCAGKEDAATDSADAGPQLGDGVEIGAFCVLLGPLRVGNRTKVAQTVHLNRDAPADAIVFSSSLRPTRRSLSLHGGSSC